MSNLHADAEEFMCDTGEANVSEHAADNYRSAESFVLFAAQNLADENGSRSPGSGAASA